MRISIHKVSTVLTAAMLISLTIGQASARPDTRYMTCSAAVSLVQGHGSILLSTGTHTYDKYVKNHAYCNLNESLRRAFVPTSDYRRCKVGFVCKNKLDFSD